jgi:hypothetical protein
VRKAGIVKRVNGSCRRRWESGYRPPRVFLVSMETPAIEHLSAN